ncbi:MAG: endolytic transglycosylase MltG [Gammaproteobacteria bacterium]|nr:endolytic transglycosylase MltG [Gammaproteobacteria bacterium]
MLRRALLLFGVGVILAGLGIGLLALQQYRSFQAELHRSFELDTVEVLELPRGTSLKTLASELQRRGWLEHPHYFEWYVRYREEAGKLKAGEYEVARSETLESLLRKLVEGRVLQHQITFIEGWTFKQLRAALAAHPAVRQTLGDKSDADVMTALGLPKEHPEGRFFADTYVFTTGTTDLDLLRRAHVMLKRRLEEVWAERQSDLPLETPYEALILASIVEKETGQASERPLIAGVFVERLRRGMRLETDPTVIYGMGERFDGNLRRKDLTTDTPYNTYMRHGLPPTPIATPGLAALQAAVNPVVDGSLFFVSKGDGSHYFSKTYREHRRAVVKYQLGGRAGGG